ncbi:RDD family protein [Paracrocinitomix mangrovi]|uniref:RDD family protein n=1 Tax=Paracrocinitomix mangrovi TaxID=2862509 RepID=UPI001C8DE57C|nr:RDD family protein [Paracrocinitomix mangrovi]UKN03754.1 RDD family protein [Paracrocinitomix mangrovi]
MAQNEITKATRFINFFVDNLIINFVVQVIVIFSEMDRFYALIFAISMYLVYYITMEYLWQQTVGKMATQSRVVDLNGNKPPFWRIVIRTLLRFNPLDGYSYAFGQEQGTHDLLSRTKLISKQN